MTHASGSTASHSSENWTTALERAILHISRSSPSVTDEGLLEREEAEKRSLRKTLKARRKQEEEEARCRELIKALGGLHARTAALADRNDELARTNQTLADQLREASGRSEAQIRELEAKNLALDRALREGNSALKADLERRIMEEICSVTDSMHVTNQDLLAVGTLSNALKDKVGLLENRIRTLATAESVDELREDILRVTAKQTVLVHVQDADRTAPWLDLMLREFNALFPQADFVLAGGAPGDLQRIKAHQGLTLFCNAAGTSRYVPPETFTQVARQGVKHPVLLVVRTTGNPSNVPSRLDGEESFYSGIFLGIPDRERRMALQWVISPYSDSIRPKVHPCPHNNTLSTQLRDIFQLVA